MNPLLDQLLVGLIVASALGFFIWRAVRKRGSKACGGGCGCGTTNPRDGGTLLQRRDAKDAK